jgi:hypothetical protein
LEPPFKSVTTARITPASLLELTPTIVQPVAAESNRLVRSRMVPVVFHDSADAFLGLPVI